MDGRCEYKYPLTEKQAEEMRRIVSGNIPPDTNGGGAAYPVSSLYFDDAEHSLYMQTHNREPYRYKLRLRIYGGEITGESLSFFEIKSKLLGRSIKRRLRLSFAENERLWRERAVPDGLSLSDYSLARDILTLIENEALTPAAVVSYSRLAFAAPGSSRLRVTFDSQLCIRGDRLDLRLGSDGTKVMPDGFCVMEVKSNENLPLWLTREISSRGLLNRSYSKYGHAPFGVINDEKLFLQGDAPWTIQSAEFSETLRKSTPAQYFST